MVNQVRTKVEVLVLGESHSTAISRAIPDDLQDKFIGIDVRKGADSSKVNDSLFQGIEPQKLVLAFGGTEHNIIGLVEAEQNFDFVWPAFDDFDHQRCLVPASALEELIRYRLESSLLRALHVRRQFRCAAFALAPPPPFRAIDEKARLPSAFGDLLALGITPATIRRKFYSVQCQVMRETYARHEIAFLEAPAKSMDAEGYLHRKLWNRDPTHGNPAYGELVLKHLEAELDV